MSYSDSDGHIDSDEYYCDECEIRFRTFDRYVQHKDQSCPDCEMHTRKSISRDGEEEFYDSHECNGRFGWHTLIDIGNGTHYVRSFSPGPWVLCVDAQFRLNLIKVHGVQFKKWWEQEFIDDVPANVVWISADTLPTVP